MAALVSITVQIPIAEKRAVLVKALNDVLLSGKDTIESGQEELGRQYNAALAEWVPATERRSVVADAINSTALTSEQQDNIISDATVTLTFIDLVRGGIIDLTPEWVDNNQG